MPCHGYIARLGWPLRVFGTPVDSLMLPRKCDVCHVFIDQKTVNFLLSEKVANGICRLLFLKRKKRLAVPNFPCL